MLTEDKRGDNYGTNLITSIHTHHLAKLEDIKHVTTIISSKAKHTLFSSTSYSNNMDHGILV